MFSFFCLYVQYNYRNRGSLTFEPLTLVPIQVKMMNTELLTQKEVRLWYSDYKNLYMYVVKTSNSAHPVLSAFYSVGRIWTFSAYNVIEILYYIMPCICGLTLGSPLLQRDWVNEYHRKCREVVGAELERQGRQEALDWLIRESQPIIWGPTLVQTNHFAQDYCWLLCSDNRLYFLMFLQVSHPASFVKHISSAVLLKMSEKQFKWLLFFVRGNNSFWWTITIYRMFMKHVEYIIQTLLEQKKSTVVGVLRSVSQTTESRSYNWCSALM